MKKVLIVTFLFFAKAGISQPLPGDSSTKGILLQQLKETFDDQQWFVPLQEAIRDLTPQQAMWKPDDSSHSVVQLVTHLIFWNERALHHFTGVPNPPATNNNDETFSTLKPGEWFDIVKRSDSLAAAWERAVAAYKPPLSAEQAQLVARVSTHNAYHTGQILYVRKQQKAWSRAKGVQ